MAVLDRTKFFERIDKIVGDRDDDEILEYYEDFKDTYDDYEKRLGDTREEKDCSDVKREERELDDADSDRDYWRKKYEDCDKEWRRRYKERFLTGRDIKEQEKEDVKKDDDSDVSYDDLFKEREGDK